MLLTIPHEVPSFREKKLPTRTEAARRIQSFIRMIQSKKLKQLFKNRRNYRRNIKKELLMTEQNFVSDLSLLIKNCYEPLLESQQTLNPILTLEDLETIFANLVEVRDSGQEFLGLLSEAIQLDDHYAKFGCVFTKFASGFKVYYPYTANYQRAQKFLVTMRQQNPLLDQFLHNVEFTEQFRDMDIFSLLVKPIQRLTKYPLLLETLLAYTDIEHPDYADLEEALALTRRLNEENNMYIEEFTKNLRQMELQEVIGNPLEVSIYHPNRRLLLEEIVYTTKDKLGQAHHIFILSDMVVYSPQLQLSEDYMYQSKPKPTPKNQANYIRLNDVSLIKDISDGKYFTNLFSIVGVNRVETFSAKDLETKQRILNTLDSALQELKRASLPQNHKIFSQSERTPVINKQVEVHAIGSEERPNGFKTYTYYILLITFGSKYVKIFKRYSDFLELSQQLHDQFPKKKLLFLSKEIEIIKSHRSKTIERRKFAIENFLQLALLDKEVRDCAHVSNFFKFPEDFFEEERATTTKIPFKQKYETSIVSLEETYARISLVRRKTTYSHKPIPYRPSLDLNTDSLPAKSSFVFEEIAAQKEDFKMNELDTASPKFLSSFGSGSLEGKYTGLPKHKIKVFLIDGTCFTYTINERTTAGEICDMISEQLHLKVNDDFRLFLSESEKLERGLDDSELIAEAIYVADELRPNQRNSLWRKFQRKFLNVFTTRPSKLVFKKFYYLSKEEEVKQYKNDYIRLKLLVAQALHEVKKIRYDLDYKDYVLLAALATYDKYREDISLIGPMAWFKQPKSKSLFSGFIPEKVYETRKESFWNAAFESHWKKLAIKLDTTVQSNKEFLEEKKCGDFKMSELDSFEMNSAGSAERILKLLIMSTMWSTASYGMTLYEAKVKYPSQQIIERGWPRDMFLFGIRPDECSIIALNRSKVFDRIKLKEIKNLKCLPVSLIISLGDENVRLDSKRSFEIYQLIRIYQQQGELGN